MLYDAIKNTDAARVDYMNAICESLVNDPDDWGYEGDVLYGEGSLLNYRTKTKIHIPEGLSPMIVDGMKIFCPTANPLAEAIHVWVAYAMRKAANDLRTKSKI